MDFVTRRLQIMIAIFRAICIILFLSCLSDLYGKESEMFYETNETEIELNHYNRTNMSMDYIPIPLPQLIGRSDLIVTGRVTEVGESTITIRVMEFLRNEYPDYTLQVKKFIPPEFDGPRPLPYANGQDFVFFLSKPKEDKSDPNWTVIGFTGEGEMPIDNGFVYFEGSYLQGLERKSYDVQGVSRMTQRFNLSDFKDAIQNYDECFSWELVKYVINNKERERWQPSRKCSDDILKKYSAKSWIHDYLVRETLNKIIPKSNNE